MSLLDNMSIWSWIGVVIAVVVFAIIIFKIMIMCRNYNQAYDETLIKEYQKKMKEENK